MSESEGKSEAKQPNPLIPDTPFTIEFLFEKLCAKTKSKPKTAEEALDGWTVEEITESAFMSSIFRVRLQWKKEELGENESKINDPEHPTSIVVKVPGPNYAVYGEGYTPSEEEVEGTNRYLTVAHSREQLFYERFSTFDPGLKLPIVYYGFEYGGKKHRNGVLIMEDLTQRAALVKMLPDGFNHRQVLAVVDEMARVHAASWRHRDEWYTPGLHDYFCGEYFEMVINESRMLHEKVPSEQKERFEQLVKRLLPVFTLDHIQALYYTDSEKFGFPPCLVHSDLWAPNILWTKDEKDGEPTILLAAIIDWQTCHLGNPCEDIIHLLALNTPGSYRRQHTEELLDFYEERVAEYMGLEVDGKKGEKKAPFTREQLREAYKQALPFGAMHFGGAALVYQNMDSLVGPSSSSNADPEFDERERNREELFERLAMLFEDVIEAFHL